MCLWGAPGHVCKGWREEEAGPLWPPSTGSRIPPPSLVGLGEKEGGEREEGKGGAPPFLVQFGPEGEGARGLPWLPLSLSTKAHRGPLVPPRVPITLRHSGFIRNFPGTLPVSEYSHPIYQYLCVDNFETPCHVHDLIWDSEQT